MTQGEKRVAAAKTPVKIDQPQVERVTKQECVLTVEATQWGQHRRNDAGDDVRQRHGSPISEDCIILKALTFDIIGTMFDAYDGWRGVVPLDAKFSLNVQGLVCQWIAHRLRGGVERFMSGQGWTPPDTVLQDATAGLLPIQRLGPKAPQAIQDFFDLWRALPAHPDVAAGCRRCITLHPGSAVRCEHCDPADVRAHAGLPFGSALRRDREAIQTECGRLPGGSVESEHPPAESLMVAAHNYDLDAANGQGFRTAFVGRPSEKGPPAPQGTSPIRRLISMLRASSTWLNN